MSKKNKVSSSKKDTKKKAKVEKKVTKSPLKNNKSDKEKAKKAVKVVKKKEAVKAPAKKSVSTTKSKTVKKVVPKKSAIAKKAVPKPLTVKASAKTANKVSKKISSKPIQKAVKPINKPASKKTEKKQVVTVKPEVIKDTLVKKSVTEEAKKEVKKDQKPREDVLAINNTIPIKKENEISLSKIASISSSITNPIKKTESYSVKPEKEPNGKFEMEFVIRASADLLYEFLYTQSGLSEWFCDDVNIRNGIYTFIWDGQMQQARLLKTIDHQLVRFQWVDKTDGSYFEFRLQHDDLTNDVSLMVTDFAEIEAERESSKLLWQSQVEKLMHVIGSIY